ncbi:hypothetical protein [Streptomyces virginiae]|uniref:hypothetical protein n=1 Tax=Streptomyces virginiae TaxID=1961 RepID=UPI003413A39E
MFDRVEGGVVATLESAPSNDTHWSRSSMAARTGLSKSTIGRIWKRSDLKPHLQDSFKLSTDPQFVDKLVDAVGALSQPSGASRDAPRRRKIPGAGAGPVAARAPMMPGMPERRPHDYLRHGVPSSAPCTGATARSSSSGSWSR